MKASERFMAAAALFTGVAVSAGCSTNDGRLIGGGLLGAIASEHSDNNKVIAAGAALGAGVGGTVADWIGKCEENESVTTTTSSNGQSGSTGRNSRDCNKTTLPPRSMEQPRVIPIDPNP